METGGEATLPENVVAMSNLCVKYHKFGSHYSKETKMTIKGQHRIEGQCYTVERIRDGEHLLLILSKEIEGGYNDPVTLPFLNQDELTVSLETPRGPFGYSVLKFMYKFQNKSSLPTTPGKYMALVEEVASVWNKREKDYPFPTWNVVEWTGKSWKKEDMYLNESQSGYDITMEDVTERVISWKELPDWLPSSVF